MKSGKIMLTREQLIWFYQVMYTSRRVDDTELKLKKQGKIFFQINSCGHEALGAAIALALEPYDWFHHYYRDRAVGIGRGYTPLDMLLDAVGAADAPSSGGRQMPSHWGLDRLVSPSSPTGSQFLPAIGTAEASVYYESLKIENADYTPGEVTVVTVGDGACGEGEFWEAMNTACLRNLPVIFIVEDNGWAISVPTRELTPGGNVALNLSCMHGLKVQETNGLDPIMSYKSVHEAISRARQREGPALIRATVVRTYSHSSSDDQSQYRPDEDIIYDILRDPVVSFVDSYPLKSDMKERLRTLGIKYGIYGDYLINNGIISEDELIALREVIDLEIAEAEKKALEASRPDHSTVSAFLYSETKNPKSTIFSVNKTEDQSSSPVTMVEAINKTLASEMACNPLITVFGEDVADATDEALEAGCEGEGGVFKVTVGLQKKFGRNRVYNTQLAEASIIGRACGQGIHGLHPVPEIEFIDYFQPAMHQLRSEVATLRWRSAGKYSCPMTIRTCVGSPYLGGTSIWHSQCNETEFTHIPGIWVVFPSNAEDAAGLLRTALRCDDPVLFLEHKGLYRNPKAKRPYPGDDYTIPFGKAKLVREGNDITIVTYGAMVYFSLLVAEKLAEEGYQAEIIDLRTLKPWDFELVAKSVKKTGRALIVHEDILFCGFGAEISASLAEANEIFFSLAAPIKRIGAKDCWVPYEPTLEAAVLPQVPRIMQEALNLLNN